MDVVRHGRPERRGRKAGVPQRVDQHADDPGRPLVGRRRQAGPLRQLAVGGRPGHPHRPGVGHVGEQGAEHHHQLRAHGSDDGDHRLAEGAPAQLRLDPPQAAACRGRRRARGAASNSTWGHSIWRSSPASFDDGPGHGEVVELLRVDGGARLGVPLPGEVVEGQGGGVAGIVPPLEGDHEQRPAQGRPVRPVDESHLPIKVPGLDRPSRAGNALRRAGRPRPPSRTPARRPSPGAQRFPAGTQELVPGRGGRAQLALREPALTGPMTTPSLRNAWLRRSRKATGWVAVGSVAGVGLFAALAAEPHHARTATTVATTVATTASGTRAAAAGPRRRRRRSPRAHRRRPRARPRVPQRRAPRCSPLRPRRRAPARLRRTPPRARR